MKLTGLSEKVFLDRYSVKDKKGNPIEKTPDEMWLRIAKAAAELEKKEDRKKWEKQFHEALYDFRYVPGGRILAGAGTGYDVTYYNCFVIPSPKDSRDGIIDTLKQMVEIMAHGGGVGFNLSSLRPRGERVKKVNGFSSGPINWAELFSLATRDIIQQGGTRRGALMLMLWDWHPDIEEFITVKKDLSRINGANLSVCVSDSFMEAVEKDADWDLLFPDRDDPEYDEKWDGDIYAWKAMGKKVIVHKTLKARYMWDLIAQAAWASAEPGIVFMERYNKYYNNWYWNKIICVNPCGEEGLPAWGVCNLGSINLSSLVMGGDIEKKGKFDFAMLRKVTRVAVRLQDNVVEMDPYIFEGIRKTQYEGERRIGLGTMGLGDMLIKLHMRYGSEESLKFIDKVYRIICEEAYRASVEIAREKGAFPKFDKEKFPQGLFIKTLPEDLQADIAKYGIRNSLLLMQAPTGSTSLMSNTTSGIEPVYEFEFKRKDRLGVHIVRHYIYDEWYKKHGKELEEGKIKRPDYFVSANDLSPEDHVKVQGVIQKYVDASISKTVNAPRTHTVEDVKRLYTMAYKLGCKGIAYMREGSREGVLERAEAPKVEEKPVVPQVTIPLHPDVPRPMMVEGVTIATESPVGKTYVTINHDDKGNPFEVFINNGKSGSDVQAMADALGRVISFTLRLHSPVPQKDRMKKIVSELTGIGGSRAVGFGPNQVRSLPDAVAKVLARHYKYSVNGKVEDQSEIKAALLNGASNGNGHIPETIQMTPAVAADFGPSVTQLPLQTAPHAPSSFDTNLFDLCPSCGAGTLANEEGCKKCYSCGYSQC